MATHCFIYPLFFLIIFAIVSLFSWMWPSIDPMFHCQYKKYSATCYRVINDWKIHGNVSTFIEYREKNESLSVNLMWDQNVIYNEKIIEKDIYIKAEIDVTLATSVTFHLHNISTTTTDKFNLCIEIIEVICWINFKHDAGCINFPIKLLTDNSILIKPDYQFDNFSLKNDKIILNFVITLFVTPCLVTMVFFIKLFYKKKLSQREYDNDDQVLFANEI